MKIGDSIRQGDVILTKVTEINLKNFNKLNHLVLAEGEKTGHKHFIQGDAELYEKDGVMYLKTNAPSQFLHDEHPKHDVGIGLYEVEYPREFDYFEMEYTKIFD